MVEGCNAAHQSGVFFDVYGSGGRAWGERLRGGTAAHNFSSLALCAASTAALSTSTTGGSTAGSSGFPDAFNEGNLPNPRICTRSCALAPTNPSTGARGGGPQTRRDSEVRNSIADPAGFRANAARSCGAAPTGAVSAMPTNRPIHSPAALPSSRSPIDRILSAVLTG